VAEADDTRQDAEVGADSEAPDRTVVREVTLDEAISMAILFLREEQPDDAEKLLRAVLQFAPEHPVALHFAGVLAHQQNRFDDGIALIERSLRADPSQADWHSNLGIVLRAAGRLDGAMAAYTRAIDLDPGHAKAHNNLGVLQRKRGLATEAEASYREAIRLKPEYAEAYHNLGVLLVGQQRVPEGVAAFNRALVLQPAGRETRRLLALAHCAVGEPEKAVQIFDEWLGEEPDNPVARHMRAACSGEAVPGRAADAYIETAFDAFAETFDEKLATLAYRAPQIVAAMLADAGAPATGELDVLDAGCGTGLCGPLFRPYARRLVGVDLSGQMLAKATDKKCYDELTRAELTGYLAAHPGAFDVVVSADTLVYFGALEEVAKAAASALRPGGRLIFTVEAAEGECAPLGYLLHYRGRYLHARSYLEDVLRRAGFATAIAQAELRMEGGLPVAGFVVRATAPAAASGSRDGADHA
jgi:predicted TPR repeat methyltransferase